MKHKKAIDLAALSDYVITISQIQCSKCKYVDDVDLGEIEGTSYFYDEGWRVVDMQCLCKKCQK